MAWPLMAKRRERPVQLQKVMNLFYPPQCALCRDLVDHGAPLCGSCWAGTPFISGVVCDSCGTQLMGENDGSDALCDECIAAPHAWRRGRAALEYRDNARRLVLAFKHGDRQDLAAPMAQWMVRAARELTHANSLLVPVPLHWMRLVRRQFNQSATLANAIGRQMSLEVCPDALIRTRRTPAQSGTLEARHANLDGALRPSPRRGPALAGRDVVLVDDVMTSGATFAAATHACLSAGARHVSVLALARVVKAP